MTDSRPHEQESEPSAPSGPIHIGTPKVEFEHASSSKINLWLNDLSKAIRSVRVYAENNEMFVKLVDRAVNGLQAILLECPELSLSVREDRLLFSGDAVHINSDRQEGLPFVLYRNAFRRITFLQGMDRNELVEFMRAITTDYSANSDYESEDLVAALWRLALPHLHYLTIDAISGGSGAGADDVSDDAKRIQASIEDIVAAIYRSTPNEDPDDIVAGVSITKEDLEALKEIREEAPEDLEALDHDTVRAIADIPAAKLDLILQEVGNENHVDLVRRVMEIFLHVLFKEQTGVESAATINVIQQLFESMVLGGRFGEAEELVVGLRQRAAHTDDLRQMHIANHLLGMFASENRIIPVIEAFNDEYNTSSVADKIRFLRALGPTISPILLGSLGTLTTPAHRRLVCELIVECGVPEPADLMKQMADEEWFAVRDILSLAQKHEPERIAPLVASALRHPHPKVRQFAVGMLRGYAVGIADRLLGERINDDEIDVRLAAARVAAARRSEPCLRELEHLLNDERTFEREPRELRTLMAAYGAIAGDGAVVLLDKLLSPGFFTRLKALDVQIAAAFALGSIGGPQASAALQKGSRTLNTKVREACRRALAREQNKGERGDDVLTSDALRIPDSATTSPNQPLPERAVADPTPPRGNSMDIDFTVGNTEDVPGLLAGAPAFSLDHACMESATISMHPIDRERPILPRVDSVKAAPEAMPFNLPPIPTSEVTFEIPPTPPVPRPAPVVAFVAPASAEAMTQSIRPPSAMDEQALIEEQTHDDIQRELMAYLGLEGEAISSPDPVVAPPAPALTFEPVPILETLPAVGPASVEPASVEPAAPYVVPAPEIVPSLAFEPLPTAAVVDASRATLPPSESVPALAFEPLPEHSVTPKFFDRLHSASGADASVADSGPVAVPGLPRFGGAASDSGAWSGAPCGPASSPAWGAPSGASLPQGAGLDSLQIGSPVEADPQDPEMPPRFLPVEPATEVAPPPRPTIPVDDLFLDEDGGGSK